MEPETTVYIIKPEGMAYRREIREKIEQDELIVGPQKVLILPSWTIDRIYPNLSVEMQRATHAMLNAPVEIALVYGHQAVQKLFQCAGTEMAPLQCAPHTIRFLFGKKEALTVGTVRYYQNVIHRPKNREEAMRDIAIFHGLP